MDFYVGGIGIALFTIELEEAQKLSLELEEQVVERLCREIIRHYEWEELDTDRKRGVAVSIIGVLYSPEEYRAHNIADLHHAIGMGLLSGKTHNLPLPPPPAPVRRVSGGLEVHLRVLPIFLYGNIEEAKKIFTKPLPAEVIATILETTLAINPEKSELHAYRSPIDFDHVVEWKTKIINQLLKRS